ncbi:MAG: ABC transporter substrate-binding protein [Ruminococcaceae bacterium]|nr:ABC transporter substrate-binding protein [Oscillospiraceae bacterium]
MKKILSVMAVLLCLSLVFASCGNTAEETTLPETTAEETTLPAEKAVINIGLLKGPTGMGAAQLLENNKNGTANADYNLTLAGAPDVLQSALINGSLDMAALPTNVAAVLHGKTEGKVQLLAVNTLGVIYLMTNNENIKTISDLQGKTILSAGQGTTTEYVLNYILSENGLTDVTVEYAAEHAEVITKAVSDGYEVILLPEPFVTQMKAQDAGYSVAIDLTKEWNALGGKELTMGCIAVRKEFAEKNPEAVKAFLKDYEASVNAVNADPAAAGTIIESFEIAKAAVASKAIPNCNIVFMTGDEMISNVSDYLNVLFTSNPKAVGGAVPAADFYCTVK